MSRKDNILLTKTTAAQNEVALNYHRVHGLYFLAAFFFAVTKYSLMDEQDMKQLKIGLLNQVTILGPEKIGNLNFN